MGHFWRGSGVFPYLYYFFSGYIKYKYFSDGCRGIYQIRKRQHFPYLSGTVCWLDSQKHQLQKVLEWFWDASS